MDDVIDLTDEQIATGLRARARGLYPVEAAVELLLAHDAWPRRRDFRRSALWVSDDGPEFIGVDWTAARELDLHAPASRSELAILTVAASLADHDTGVHLGDALTGLDQTNTTLVLHAIAHAAGWHERGTTALVTGAFPGRRARLTGPAVETTRHPRRKPVRDAPTTWPPSEQGQGKAQADGE